MVKKGDIVLIKPSHQDPGENRLLWQALENEDGGRVKVAPLETGLKFPPVHIVKIEWLETD